jgi:hypothetical protein
VRLNESSISFAHLAILVRPPLVILKCRTIREKGGLAL